ncbi:MAG: acyl carrier protein [Rhodobacteraceae bacterium]|nr:acyl carrier protein [Paracoccaceae bacterium]
MTDIRNEVMRVIEKVAGQRGINTARIGFDSNLIDIGLKSLDLSQIVARLEVSLAADPFLTRPITDIRTVSDLSDAYESELSQRPGTTAEADPPKPVVTALRDGLAPTQADRRRTARSKPGDP